MTEDSVVALHHPGVTADPLSEVLRAGARELLAQAIEAEVAAVLAAHEHLKTEDGRRRLVRHGHGPERAILTGIGPVSVRRPEGPGPWQRRRRAHPFHVGHSAPFRAADAVAGCGFADALPSWRVQRGLPGGAGGVARQGRLWLVGAGDRPPEAEWEAEHERWRDLSARRYVYMWADGIYLQGRLEDEKQCILVLIGATPEGRKELVGFQAGVRESAQSWRELLACLRGRGLTIGPELAIGDGALGFWKALEEIFPDTRRQRCWVHKTANVLNKLPKSRQTAAKAALHDIWMADGRAEAERAMNTFAAKYDAKYPQAVACLTKDRDALLAFYDFPAEHWRHIRTTNPIESVFATVRHRTVRTKGCLSHGDNSGHGLQADHHRQQDLAAAHGKQSVAQGHRRCEIQRRYADRRNQNSRRRLITPSPKIGHNSNRTSTR